jgi:hypothetical protein
LRRLSDTGLSVLRFLGVGFAQGGSPPRGSIRGEVFTKGTNGEPAVLPGVLIVLHGSITKETESDAQGAFAVDGLPGTYEIEANAPGLYAAFSVEVSAGTSSRLQGEMNVTAVTSSVNVTATDASIAEESVQYGPVSQSALEKATNQEKKIESLPPQPLNSFEDDPEIFLTEDNRKWLKAMDCAFSRKVHHA